MDYLKQKEDIDGTRRPKCPKPLFVGAKTFMTVATKGDAFLIYVFPSPNVEPCPHEILSQYQEFKDVFKKRNVDTLSKHRPYNCTIDIVEGAQPPFISIYNLSQYKLAVLCEYLDENLEKRFIQHSKSLASAPILFIKKKMTTCKCVSIIMDLIDSPSTTSTFCP
jgi:hypothetical protein